MKRALAPSRKKFTPITETLVVHFSRGRLTITPSLLTPALRPEQPYYLGKSPGPRPLKYSSTLCYLNSGAYADYDFLFIPDSQISSHRKVPVKSGEDQIQRKATLKKSPAKSTTLPGSTLRAPVRGEDEHLTEYSA